ncbi:MAG: ATP-binding protein [Ignavibacteriales bacterium]|nr:ATP-binding protein [Ignavibacteriales bacterium]
MSSEMVDNLFSLTGTKKPKRYCQRKGTGLGMNITHDLLKTTGGDIKVESSPEKAPDSPSSSGTATDFSRDILI